MDVLEIVSAFGPLLIAGVVAYVMWKQKQISRDQLRLALFRKRYRIYDGLTDLVGAVVGEAAVSDQDILKFNASTHDRVFLFEEEMDVYLKEVLRKAIDLRRIKNELGARQLPKDKDRTQLEEEEEELVIWFAAQYKVSTQKFHKYLHFETHL